MLLKKILVVLNVGVCFIRCDAVDISFRQSAKSVGVVDEVTTGILQVLRAKSDAFPTEDFDLDNMSPDLQSLITNLRAEVADEVQRQEELGL